MLLNIKAKFLLTAGVIASAAAVWHLLCIWGGTSWFIFARAPIQIIESSQQGTFLAPLGSIAIAGLMFACTAFALSAIGLVRNIAFTRTALIAIATLCIIRSLIIIPALIRADTWNIIASSVWLYVGVCFLVGAITFHNLKPTTNS